LAIIEGMNVKIGQEIMTIPMVSVVELISPRAEQLATVEGKGELVEVRGEYMPVVRLQELLEAGAGERTLGVDTVVVVVESDHRRFGILVDRVLGLEQAVVKPLQKTFSVVQRLEKQFARPEGVAGATILGNGDVALILDVPGIERMAFGTLQ
jgi:two-component system chemotaxis sensor kinase CheA